ncbi:hypothetical protein [Micromonospora sp. SL4-19]|uniref:hypothetical protein n=1 Tax=Micromonospora sp. SL4-19 TaxID=3399129 RepID=UPI003A4DFD5A
MDDDRIDQLVASAAPAATIATDEEIGSLLHHMAGDVIQEQPARSRSGFAGDSSRWRRLLVAPLAAGAVMLTAAAGFVVWHDSASPDFEQALTQYTAELPLPPGTDRAAYVAQVREQGLEQPVTVSDLTVNGIVSYYGVCAWLTAWDRRHAAGDEAGEAEAVTALRRAITAPALGATDGGGVVENLQQVVAAAAAGDRSPVDTELNANCAGLPLEGIR